MASHYGAPKTKAGKGCKNCGRVKHLHRPSGLGGLLCPVQFRKRDLSRPISEFLYAPPLQVAKALRAAQRVLEYAVSRVEGLNV